MWFLCLLNFLIMFNFLFSLQNRVQSLQRCEASKDDPGQVPVPAPGREDQSRDQLQRHLQGPGAAAVCWQQGAGEEEDTQSVQRALHRPYQTGESYTYGEKNEGIYFFFLHMLISLHMSEVFKLRNLISTVRHP